MFERCIYLHTSQAVTVLNPIVCTILKSRSEKGVDCTGMYILARIMLQLQSIKVIQNTLYCSLSLLTTNTALSYTRATAKSANHRHVMHCICLQ